MLLLEYYIIITLLYLDMQLGDDDGFKTFHI